MSLTADSGEALDGLNTTVLPASSAALVGPVGEGHREVERADDARTRRAVEDRAGVDRRVAEVAHRVVVEGVVLRRLRVVADEVGGLLDLAERLDAGSCRPRWP